MTYNGIKQAVYAVKCLSGIFPEKDKQDQQQRKAVIINAGMENKEGIINDLTKAGHTKLAQIFNNLQSLEGTPSLYIILQELYDGKLGDITKITKEEMEVVHCLFPKINSESALELLTEYFIGFPTIISIMPSDNLSIEGLIRTNAIRDYKPEGFPEHDIKTLKVLIKELGAAEGKELDLARSLQMQEKERDFSRYFMPQYMQQDDLLRRNMQRNLAMAGDAY